jgi:DNA repair protein RecO (recombination protein O)
MDSREVQAQAILLRRFDYGDRDRILWLLTEERGRISAFAAGARSSRKRYAGLLEPFALMDARLRPPQRGDLWRLGEVQLLEPHSRLRGSLEAIACAGAACELSAGLSHEGEPVPQLFARLCEYLRLLDRDGATAAGLSRHQLLALDASGVRPQVAECVRCGDEGQSDGDHFDPAEGGRLCPRCVPRFRSAVGASGGALAELAALQCGDGMTLGAEAHALLWHFVEHHLGHRLRSFPMLEELGLA